MESLESAILLANILYGTDINPDLFLEQAMIAWGRIGNKYSHLYRLREKICVPDFTVELPCNVSVIEAVTYDFEDWQYTTNINPNGDYSSLFTENYIEGRKMYLDSRYVGGKFAKYVLVDNTLHFDKDYGSVNILYKGIYVDENGLPLINEKEKDAIAAFCAYANLLRQGLATLNTNLIQTALLIKVEWLRLCDAARVPIYINQNEMNEILDSKTTWNRKVFGKSLKAFV